MNYIIDSESIIKYTEILFDKSKDNKYFTTKIVDKTRQYVGGRGRSIFLADKIHLYRQILSFDLLKIIGKSFRTERFCPNVKEINQSILHTINENPNYVVITSDRELIDELNKIGKSIEHQNVI